MRLEAVIRPSLVDLACMPLRGADLRGVPRLLDWHIRGGCDRIEAQHPHVQESFDRNTVSGGRG